MVSAAPIREANGKVVGVIATMIDVTQRKRSERMLAASEARKDAILRAALDAVVIVDHEGLIVEVNPRPRRRSAGRAPTRSASRSSSSSSRPTTAERSPTS